VEAAPEIPVRRQSRSLAWGLATAVGLAAGLAGYVAHSALTNHTPKQEVRVQRLTDMVGLEESPALSPDGKTVAFVATSGGRRQIWVRLLAGGTPLQITNDTVDHYEPRWARDSTSLLCYTPGQEPGSGIIWEIPVSGGSAREVVRALAPGDFSHDGKSLAFVRFGDNAAELAVEARDGSSTRAVAKLKGGLYSNLRWSPDDQSVALLENTAGVTVSTALIVASLSSGELRKVSDSNELLDGFTWLPDGSGLIVSSARGSAMADSPTYNLRIIPRANGAPSQVTFGEDSYESPDMNLLGNLVVSRVRKQSDIWKFPVTGDPADNVRRAVRITRQTGQVQAVTLSPDETEVAFLSDDGGHANIWVARVSDGKMRPITHETDPGVAIGAPVWSPRGDGIYFVRNGMLWSAPLDGGDARDLGMKPPSFCWSGDGRWLYQPAPAGGASRFRKLPAMVPEHDPAGCIPASASSAGDYAAAIQRADAGSPFELQPSFSPDGKWFAMPSLDGSTTNLWALPTAGGDWRKLTDYGARNVIIAPRVAWSKDGKYLYAAVSDVDSDIVMLLGLKWR
jgi:Tol biopolymer transport system component